MLFAFPVARSYADVCGATHFERYESVSREFGQPISQRIASHIAVVIPLIDDSVWLERFEGAARFAVPHTPVLVVAPHPDDETLGAGALIARLRANGVAVTVVAATDGENAYDIPGPERIALGETRAREQREALAVLGVEAASIKRLRLTDSGLMALEMELAERLLEFAEPDMTIVAPWVGDFHPDHEACARAAGMVADAMGLPLISYFFWTWHRGRPELLDGLPLRRFDADARSLQAKALALSMHASQLGRDRGDPILSERLLAPARWPFEMFLSL